MSYGLSTYSSSGSLVVSTEHSTWSVLRNVNVPSLPKGETRLYSIPNYELFDELKLIIDISFDIDMLAQTNYIGEVSIITRSSGFKKVSVYAEHTTTLPLSIKVVGR